MADFNWHCFSNQPIQPFLVFPTHPPKSSLVRKFAQFCLYLPSHIARPGVPGNCFPAECTMWHTACGCSLGAQGMQELSSFLVPTALGRAHHSLMLRGNLPAHAFLHCTFHTNPICTWVPALQLVWKVRDSLACHLL